MAQAPEHHVINLDSARPEETTRLPERQADARRAVPLFRERRDGVDRAVVVLQEPVWARQQRPEHQPEAPQHVHS